MNVYVRKFRVGRTQTHTHIYMYMNRVGNRSMFSPVVVALRVVHCNTYNILYIIQVLCISLYIFIYTFISYTYIRMYDQKLSK